LPVGLCFLRLAELWMGKESHIQGQIVSSGAKPPTHECGISQLFCELVYLQGSDFSTTANIKTDLIMYRTWLLQNFLYYTGTCPSFAQDPQNYPICIESFISSHRKSIHAAYLAVQKMCRGIHAECSYEAHFFQTEPYIPGFCAGDASLEKLPAHR